MMTDPGMNVTPERGGVRNAIRPAVIATAIAVIVLAIGLSGGGYELPVSGEVVILAAWLILMGAIVGAVPEARPAGASVLASFALLGLTVWALISIDWSDAAGRSVAVAIQYAVVLATLLVGSLLFRRGDRPAVLAGLLAGVAGIAGIAVASRLHPGIAPEPSDLVDSARMQARLHWPVGYWNTLGFLAAMGLPLALHLASDSRRAISRALSAATVPALVLCVLFTISRGAIATTAVGVLVGLALGPVTVRRIAFLAVSVAASAWLVSEAVARRALMDGLTARGPGVGQAGDVELLAILIAVGLAVVAAAGGFLPKRLTEPRRDVRLWLRGVVSLLVVALAAGGLMAGGQGPRIERAFDDFRNARLKVDADKTNSLERLGAQGSSGRWQLWEAAIDEGNTKPLTGTGAGTFEEWWTRNSDEYFTVRNAHSQYLEIYAELGWVGIGFLIAFLAAIAWGCISGLRGARGGAQLGASAAGTATVAAFCFSTAFDWGWQVTVLPVVAMLAFAAVAATAGGADEDVERSQEPAGDEPDVESDEQQASAAEADQADGDDGIPGTGRMLPWRFGAGVAAVALLMLAVPPVVATHSITESQREFKQADFVGSLRQANAAVDWQPYSAAAWLQRGLVYDALGDRRKARVSVVGAIDRDPGNWRYWLTLAGIEARAGNTRAALRAYRKARDLNPGSSLFAVGN